MQRKTEITMETKSPKSEKSPRRARRRREVTTATMIRILRRRQKAVGRQLADQTRLALELEQIGTAIKALEQSRPARKPRTPRAVEDKGPRADRKRGPTPAVAQQ